MAEIKKIFNLKIVGTNDLIKLRNEISTTEKALKKLKSETKKNGELTEEQSRKFIELETSLKANRKNYRGAQKDLQNLSQAQKKSGSFTMKMAKAFGLAQLAVDGFKMASRALMRQIQDSVKVFADFDIQMQKVKAISGANATEFGQLAKSAQELGRSTFFTATQVAELQMNFSKLGFTATEVLAAQSAALDMATATGEDLARTATVIGSSIRGFNLDASEAGRVADVMAASFTSSALDLEKFQTSMTKVAPIAELMGVSIEETTAIMGKLSDAGIEASIAGTSLRNIFLKMGDPSSDLAKALGKTIGSGEELVQELKNLRDACVDVEKMLAVVDQRQVAAFATMVKGVDVIEKQILALEGAEGAAANMASTVGDSLQGAMLRFKSALDGLKIVIVESFAPVLQNTIDGLAKLFNAFTRIADNPLSKSLEQDRLAMNDLFETLKKTNISQDTRTRLLAKLNKQYKEYLPDLITEETTLDDLAIAQRNANSALQERINLLAAEEILSEIRRKQLEIQINQSNLASQETTLLREQQDLLNGSTERALRNSQGVDIALSNNKVALQNNQDAQKENRKELEKLSGEYETATKAVLDLGGSIDDLTGKTGGGTGGAGGTGGGGSTVTEETDPVAEELARLEFEMRESMLVAREMFADREIQTQDDLNNVIMQKQLIFLNEMLKTENLTAEQRLAIKERIAKVEVAQANQQIKLEKDKKDALLENINTMKETGNVLMNIGQITGKNSLAAKAGIKISQAAAIADGVHGLINAKVGIAAQAKLPFPSNILAMASTAAQVASIVVAIKQLLGGAGGSGGGAGDVERASTNAEGTATFARGGLTRGGVFQGASHANGGVKFAVGGRVMEAEGGEAIINKRSTSAFRPILSAINSFNGNGVKFADGGLISSGERFALGGELRSIQNIVSNNSGTSQVIVVESEVTTTQNRVSALESQASF